MAGTCGPLNPWTRGPWDPWTPRLVHLRTRGSRDKWVDSVVARRGLLLAEALDEVDDRRRCSSSPHLHRPSQRPIVGD